MNPDPWYDTDHLLTEMMGVNRNVIVVVFAFGFIFWQILEVLAKKYGGENPNFILSVAPLLTAFFVCTKGIIPAVRRWNDTHPKGHFEGMTDFYLNNPETLELGNDPEPLPTYIPSQKV